MDSWRHSAVAERNGPDAGSSGPGSAGRSSLPRWRSRPPARAVLTVAGVWLSQYLLGRAFPPRIVVAPWLNGPERTETSSSQE